MDRKLKSWENPNCPSGQLEQIFKDAEKFRAIQQAPSVRLDHFLLAALMNQYPPLADDILKLLAEINHRE